MTIVPGQSIGACALRMSTAEVEAVLGKPQHVAGHRGFLARFLGGLTYRYGPLSVHFDSQSHLVSQLLLSHGSDAKFDDSVGVGSPLSLIRSRYPSLQLNDDCLVEITGTPGIGFEMSPFEYDAFPDVECTVEHICVYPREVSAG